MVENVFMVIKSILFGVIVTSLTLNIGLSGCQSSSTLAKKTSSETKEPEDPSQPCDSLEQCIHRVTQKITNRWEISKLYDPDKITKIQIKLSRDGEVLKTGIIQSSGEQELDKSILSAIEKSTPFEFIAKSKEDIQKAMYSINITFSVKEAKQP